MHVELIAREVQLIEADALLLPVDGQGCRLGSGALSGIRAALPEEDRIDELEYLERELYALRPIPAGQARVIDGVADWRWMIVSAAYPHNVDGHIFTAHECAAMLRHALPNAIALADGEGIPSLAMTVIGTGYRIKPRDLAIRALADGLAAASTASLTLRWSLPHAGDLAHARDACHRLGLAAAIV